MEYLTFILHILALLSLSSIMFVPEEKRYIPKMIVFLLLFISIVYNRVFICNCVKGWFGTCKLPSIGKAPTRAKSSSNAPVAMDDLDRRLAALKV